MSLQTSKVVVIVGLYDTWLALLSSLMVSAGMDLENPRPLHVFVGVLTSVTTGFLEEVSGHQVLIKSKTEKSGSFGTWHQHEATSRISS